MKNFLPTRADLAHLLCAIVVTVPLGSCNIAGPAIYMIQGPPKTPAAYLLENRPAVVFVDDRKNLMPRFELRAMAGDEAAKLIMEQKLITRVYSSRDALNLARKQETDKQLMPIDAIGREVGAELVIYVKVVNFALSPDGYTPRPVAGVQVRVIDAVNQVRLFPPEGIDSERYIEATLGNLTGENYQSTAVRRQLEDRLATELGRQVAKLFYDHEGKELGSNLR